MSGVSNSSTGNMSRHLKKEHAGEVVLSVFEKDDSVFVRFPCVCTKQNFYKKF